MKKADKYLNKLKITYNKSHKEKVKKIIFEEKEKRKIIFPFAIKSFSYVAVAATAIFVFIFTFTYFNIINKNPVIVMKTTELKYSKEEKSITESPAIPSIDKESDQDKDDSPSIQKKQDPIKSKANKKAGPPMSAARKKEKMSYVNDEEGFNSLDYLKTTSIEESKYGNTILNLNKNYKSFSLLQKIINDNDTSPINDLKENEIINYFCKESEITNNIYVEGCRNFFNKDFIIIFIKPKSDISNPTLELKFSDNLKRYNIIGYANNLTDKTILLNTEEIKPEEPITLLIEISTNLENDLGKINFNYKDDSENINQISKAINYENFNTINNTSLLLKKCLLAYMIIYNIKYNTYETFTINNYLKNYFRNHNQTLSPQINELLNNFTDNVSRN